MGRLMTTTFTITLQDDFNDSFEDAQADIAQSKQARQLVNQLLPYLTMNDALDLAKEIETFNNNHF